MKKAIIIFSIGLSLIVVGGIKTASEVVQWNKTDTTFEEAGLKSSNITSEVNIENYSSLSLSDNLYYSMYYSELDKKIIVDKNQEKGKLKQSVVYYPSFGECSISNNAYIIDSDGDRIFIDEETYKGDSKVYLDVNVYCYNDFNIVMDILNPKENYQTFKTVMKLKKLPTSVKQVVITINPEDEDKIIK